MNKDNKKAENTRAADDKDKSTIFVTVLGNRYPLAGGKNPAEVMAAAKKTEEAIQQIIEKRQYLSVVEQLVLTMVNLSDEYLKAVSKNNSLTKENDRLKKLMQSKSE